MARILTIVQCVKLINMYVPNIIAHTNKSNIYYI